LNDLKLSLIEKGRLSTTLQFGEPKMIDVDVDAHEAELAALPKLTEDDDEMATLTQTISTLADSQTSVAYGDEGLAFDDSAFALDGNDEEDNDGEDDEVSRSQRTSSFSISLKMRDIPRFSVKIDASEAASLGRIMEDPTLCEKLGTMTEMEMRKTLDAEDSESTASSENDGIGSRRESVDDEDVDEDEEKTEEEDPEAKELIDAQIAGKLLERQGLAKARQSVTGQLGHRFSMAARPDVQSEHISSGMSSVFLKRSVDQIRQWHLQAQRRSSLAKTSNDLINPRPLSPVLTTKRSKLKFSTLKARFEQEIAFQRQSVRRSSLKGHEAKEELEKTKETSDVGVDDVDCESKEADESNEFSFDFPVMRHAKTEVLPTPRKLVRRVTRVDNPWIRKLAQQGHNHSESRCEMVSIMRKMGSPRRATNFASTPRKVQRQTSVRGKKISLNRVSTALSATPSLFCADSDSYRVEPTAD